MAKKSVSGSGAPYGGTGGSKHMVPPQKEGTTPEAIKSKRSNSEGPTKSAVSERKSESWKKSTVGS